MAPGSSRFSIIETWPAPALIGYEQHAGDRVELFMLESFTFRVLGPEAIVRLG
jgi:uncharacterized linocin/CFP29 family protein